MSIGALHHINELENVINIIKGILEVDGYFVLVEYIGPKQFQWTEKQILIINKILKLINFKYLSNKNINFNKPTLEEMNKIDPTEAIRSNEIYDLIKNNFFVEYERMYNGTIIHQLYPLLNSRLSNKNKVDFDSILNLIILMEKELINSGALESDFVFMILRNKKEQ